MINKKEALGMANTILMSISKNDHYIFIISFFANTFLMYGLTAPYIPESYNHCQPLLWLLRLWYLSKIFNKRVARFKENGGKIDDGALKNIADELISDTFEIPLDELKSMD
ncbi:MAG: hypothetical protein FWF92_09165 [Oscillospiraceae bacterium]|nr:hypothetical protein [Oscillospiraceae bacterium]